PAPGRLPAPRPAGQSESAVSGPQPLLSCRPVPVASAALPWRRFDWLSPPTGLWRLLIGCVPLPTGRGGRPAPGEPEQNLLALPAFVSQRLPAGIDIPHGPDPTLPGRLPALPGRH